MPSKRITKVTSLTRNKKGDYLIEAGDYSFVLSPSTFTDFYLYSGKELSDAEIMKLKEASSLSSLYEYALSLLSKKLYSKWEMQEKLLKKNPNTHEVFLAIKRLEECRLIDDESYANEYKEEKERALYGQKRIKDELAHKKHIDAVLIAKLKFENEEVGAKAYLKTLERKLSVYPYLIRKKKAKEALYRRGFLEEASSIALEEMCSTDGEEVKAKLYSVATRAYIRYEKKYKGDELDYRLRTYLYKKGYSVDDIDTCLERIYDEH